MNSPSSFRFPNHLQRPLGLRNSVEHGKAGEGSTFAFGDTPRSTKETTMLPRMLCRVVALLSLAALTCLLVAGHARAQFRGRQQTNTAQPLSQTTVQRQQAGT